MHDKSNRRRCPQCRRDDALVVNYHYWQAQGGQRKLIDADIRCTKCSFTKQLVEMPVRSAAT